MATKAARSTNASKLSAKTTRSVKRTPPENFSDSYWHNQPKWLNGTSVSYHDARFLFREAFQHARSPIVEIGTASGFSTGLLCHAMHFAAKSGRVEPDYDIVTYDIDVDFFANKTKRSGDAAREQLPAALLKRVTFRSPAVAYDAARDFGRGGIGFMFIDACHEHPWPVLDLLATLDSLANGAVVVLHDINLPIIHPEFPGWGAKFLFDGVHLEKRLSNDPDDKEIPNIGAIVIPANRRRLRAELLDILFHHPWTQKVSEAYLKAIGIDTSSRNKIVLSTEDTENPQG